MPFIVVCCGAGVGVEGAETAAVCLLVLIPDILRPYQSVSSREIPDPTTGYRVIRSCCLSEQRRLLGIIVNRASDFCAIATHLQLRAGLEVVIAMKDSS